MPPLELDGADLDFAVEWLESAAAHFTDLGIEHNNNGLIALAGLCTLFFLGPYIAARMITFATQVWSVWQSLAL